MNGLFDLDLTHQEHVVHHTVDNGVGVGAGLFYRDTVGNGLIAGIIGENLMISVVHGRIQGRLYAMDFDLGLQRLGGDAHAGNQPTTADSDDHGVQIGFIFKHFQRYRALARDDLCVVIGVDEGITVLGAEIQCMIAGFDKAVPVQHHLGTQGLGAGNLGKGRVFGHDDGGGGAQLMGEIAHPLGVIARRRRNNSGLALIIRKAQQLNQRTAHLERAGMLQIFQLQPHLGTAQLGQLHRRYKGRP